MRRLGAAAVSEGGVMRLNGASAQGLPGDLVVRQDDLGAVGHEAYELHGRLRRAAEVSGGPEGGTTTRAATHLTGHDFELGRALAETVRVWESQVRTVLQGCAHISNHLDYSRKAHARDDAQIAASMRRAALPPSRISELLS